MRIRVGVLLIASMFLSLPSLTIAQDQPAPPAEKVAPIFGQTIHYIDAGQGQAVILLHGLGATKEVWLATFVALSAEHHVYAIDQLGFGRSDKPMVEYKIATWVDFLQGFMQAQNLGKATLVGNSLGGWIALDFTVQHPEMVDKLVLVDSLGLPWGGAASVDLNPSSLAGWRALLESLFYDKKMVSDGFVQKVFSDSMRSNVSYTIQRTLAGFAQANFEDEKLQSIHAPTLVVWGRNDELVKTDQGEKFRNGIPGAKLVVLEQCGHLPQVEKPADFNRALLDFLGK